MLLALVGYVILAIKKLAVNAIRYMYQKTHPYLAQVGNAILAIRKLALVVKSSLQMPLQLVQDGNAILASQKMEIVVTKLKNRWIILKNSKR